MAFLPMYHHKLLSWTRATTASAGLGADVNAARALPPHTSMIIIPRKTADVMGRTTKKTTTGDQ